MSTLIRHTAAVAALAGALLISSCGGSDPIEAGDAPLNADEMRTVLEGNSVVGDNWDGPFTVYFPVYGEIRGLLPTATYHRARLAPTRHSRRVTLSLRAPPC